MLCLWVRIWEDQIYKYFSNFAKWFPYTLKKRHKWLDWTAAKRARSFAEHLTGLVVCAESKYTLQVCWNVADGFNLNVVWVEFV